MTRYQRGMFKAFELGQESLDAICTDLLETIKSRGSDCNPQVDQQSEKALWLAHNLLTQGLVSLCQAMTCLADSWESAGQEEEVPVD